MPALRFVKSGHRGSDVADEDGGAELDRDAVGIVAEPERGITFQFFIGAEFEGVAVDLAHADTETDGFAIEVGFAANDVDPKQIGCAEWMDDESDLISGIELLAADMQHGGEDIKNR